MKQEKPRELIGKTRSYVNNRLRLLQCDASLIDELCALLNRPNKADSFARNRADQPLLVAVVVYCSIGSLFRAGSQSHVSKKLNRGNCAPP